MKTPMNTNCFEFYNANPKNKKTTDCVIRAICTALDQSYDQTVVDLAAMQINTGYDMSDVKCFGKYLESKGWTKHKQPRKNDNTKYTGREFVKIFNGICVANIGGNHTVCIKEGKVYDIWDSTDGCIGNYWTKEIRR